MKPNYTRIGHRQGSRGIALITALLLLSLFTIMTLAMVIATSSDLLIDGYYRNLRGSFYAADSGLNAARQFIAIQIGNNVTANYVQSANTPPIPNGAEVTVMTALGNSSTGFGGTQSILSTSGPQASSWPGTFTISYNAACATTGGANCPTYMLPWTAANCSANYVYTQVTPPAAVPNPAVYPLPTCANPGDPTKYNVLSYSYSYPYKITAVGNSVANQQNTIQESGNLVANVTVTSTYSTSFAAYGTLFDQYSMCSGGFVKGTMSGRFFSNDTWNFGDSAYGSGNYIFTGNVGAVNSQVGYMYGNGTCHQSSNTSDSYNGTTIAPTFQGGLNLSQTAIPLPPDAYNQQKAVLDGKGNCPPAGPGYACTAPVQADRAAVLRNAADAAWPSSGSEPTTGVYLPYTDTLPSPAAATCPVAPCFTGGGIYVQGNADQVTMSAATVTIAGAPHSEQVFTIKQGSTITTVTLDLTGNTTTIADNAGGGHSKLINDLPRNLNSSGSNEAAMLFVNGNISGTSGGNTTGLSGPSSGAAIQDGSAVTVTSMGTIAITGNLLYTSEPVTLNAADTPITPAPTNVLGIYTPTGDVQLRPTTNVSSMEIDASIATISSSGSGGMIATWNTIGTVTIVGGRIQNQAKSGSSVGTRNIWFDQRFSHGFAPPWFPSTTVTTTPTTQTQVTPSRVSWTNTTAM